MIEHDDLKAAVAAGLISEKQAASLASLADSRRGARENLAAGDEPFELFKGFNEIFIVVGLGILAFGWVAFSAFAMSDTIANVANQIVLRSAISAIAIWALAEYFIRHRRMVAPAIFLSGLFAVNAAVGFSAQMSEIFMLMQNDISTLPLPLVVATVATFIFWVRFRVPIALAFVAVGLFAAAVAVTAAEGARPENLRDFFLLSAGSDFAWLTLALGLITFIVAMAFDMSDPHRVTRRSAQGFWLHVVAAPAIVNTVALTLISSEDPGNMSLLIAFLALIAVVAIIIDRRSFLITAVGYVIAVAAALTDVGGTAWSILLLGFALVFLGAFWEKIRARLLRLVAPILPIHRFPPSQVTMS